MSRFARSAAVTALVVGATGLVGAPAAQATASVGYDFGCYAYGVGSSCSQVVRGVDQHVQDRGSVVQFECVAAIPSTRVLAVTITSCVARDIYSGEEVRGLQNGTNTPTSATLGVSTTDAPRGRYQVCMTTQYLTIQGAQSLPEFCSTVNL